MGDLGKTIIATGFEGLPKVNKIALSGHTGQDMQFGQHKFQIHLYLFFAAKYTSHIAPFLIENQEEQRT